MGPIFESELQPKLESEAEALIDPRLRRAPKHGIELSGPGPYSEPSSAFELNYELSRPGPTRAQSRVLSTGSNPS